MECSVLLTLNTPSGNKIQVAIELARGGCRHHSDSMLIGLRMWEQQAEEKLDRVGSARGSSSGLGCPWRKELGRGCFHFGISVNSVFPILTPLSAVFVLSQIPYHKLCPKYTNIFATKKFVLSAVSLPAAPHPQPAGPHIVIT